MPPQMRASDGGGPCLRSGGLQRVAACSDRGGVRPLLRHVGRVCQHGGKEEHPGGGGR